MLIRVLLAFALAALGGCARQPVTAAPERLPQVPSVMTADRGADPQLKDAAAKAQETLDSFVGRLSDPARGETFSIEGPFSAADGTPIYLWISDLTFRDGVFEGTITTHPKIPTTHKYGDRVKLRREQVTDWMILKSGRSEGGFTIDVLMKREGAPK